MSKIKEVKEKPVDNSICFYCGEKLTEERWIIAMDVPYINIYIHRDCKEKYLSEKDTFLKENQARINEYVEKYGRHGKGSTKAKTPKPKTTKEKAPKGKNAKGKNAKGKATKEKAPKGKAKKTTKKSKK